MKRKQLIFDKISAILDYYDSYLTRNKGTNLVVTIKNNTILICVYIIIKKEIKLVKGIRLVIPKKEENFYRYLAMKIIIKIFKYVVMHYEDHTLFNSIHLANKRIYIFDDYLEKQVKEIIKAQDSVFLNDDLQIMQDLITQNPKVKGYRKIKKSLNLHLQKLLERGKI